MTVKKAVGVIHLWLGFLSGLIVLVLGTTGCLYVFVDELKPLIYQDRYYVAQQPVQKKSISELVMKANIALGEGRSVQGIELFNDPARSYHFRWSSYKPEALTFFGQIEDYTIYLNPYTGEVLKNEHTKLEFFNLVLNLHWDLYLGEPGRTATGIATLTFVVMLITGMILWWPKNKAAAKQRFWFRWKSTTKWKRKNYDLHNIPGFYVMLIALIIAITGTVFVFGWMSKVIGFVADIGTSEVPHEHHRMYSDTTRMTGALPLDRILHQVRAMAPEAEGYSLYLPEDKKQTFFVSANGTGPDYTAVDYEFDQHTAALLEIHRFEDNKLLSEKLRHLNYDIHVGSALGLPGKVLAFLASFVAASLPVTGAYIWWGRRRKEKER